MSANPGVLISDGQRVRFEELIEPPMRVEKERKTQVGKKKRIEAKMFLKSVADRQKTVVEERIRAQKATWEPPKRPSASLHIYDDNARILEHEKLWKELHTLTSELSHLRESKSSLNSDLHQLQAKLSSVHQASPRDIAELESLRETLAQQRARLAKELEELQSKDAKRELSTSGVALTKCVFCLENADKFVPDVQQKIAELRLKHQTLLEDLNREKDRLETRVKAVRHYQGILGSAPNVERQERKMREVEGKVDGLKGRLRAREELVEVAKDEEQPDTAVVEALEKVREADSLPKSGRSHSVTVFCSKDAWATAPSSIRAKLSELHKDKFALTKELESVEADLQTPIEHDAYLYAEIRKIMIEKKVKDVLRKR